MDFFSLSGGMIKTLTEAGSSLVLGTSTTTLITISPPNAEIGPVTLPESVYGHCTVLVDDIIYLIGGYWMVTKTSNKGLSIMINNGKMTPIPNLKFGRIHHGCATFTYGNKKFIVVAGANRGYSNYYSVSKTSEIFDVQANVWKEGPTLPASCEYAKMITSPEGDGAIFIGSSCNTISNEFFQNVIYQLKPLSNGTIIWTTINRKFKSERILPVIDYIDESKVNSYPKPTTTENPTTEPITPVNPRFGMPILLH